MIRWRPDSLSDVAASSRVFARSMNVPISFSSGIVDMIAIVILKTFSVTSLVKRRAVD